MILLGGDIWELVPCFSWTLPHAPSPFADFNWYPSVVINHNHESKSFSKSFVSPSSQSLSLRVVLGNETHLTPRVL